MSQLRIDKDTSVLVLTGAGISAESGIPTFRGIDGLWENHPVEKVASPEGFRADPTLVWRFYSQRRIAAQAVQPNPGHRALADLERRLGDRFLLATQNVDGLHRKAGSERVVEMHGQLFSSRCSSCARPPFHDEKAYEQPPRCELCGEGLLRPHIVWFGEMLDAADLERIHGFLASAAPKGRVLFLAIGTSGAVYPAAGLVDLARDAGADTWLINADPAENAGRFHHFIRGKSGEVLPDLLA